MSNFVLLLILLLFYYNNKYTLRLIVKLLCVELSYTAYYIVIRLAINCATNDRYDRYITKNFYKIKNPEKIGAKKNPTEVRS